MPDPMPDLMHVEMSRNSESRVINGEFGFTQAGIDLAFRTTMDQEEKDLFSDIYSPDWLAVPSSERFAVLSRLALRIEEAFAKTAKTLNETLQDEEEGVPA